MADSTSSLRFGIMVSGTTIRRWQAEVIKRLVEVDGVELHLVVIDARSRPGGGAGERIARILKSRTRLWDLYNNGWVGRRARSLKPVLLDEVAGGVERLEVQVDRRGWSEFFSEADVEAVRSAELDFVLRFGFGIIRGEILDAARYGVWSFHHDDEDHYRGSPPAFWEIVEGQAVSGAVLQRLTDRLDGGRILHKGWFRTVAQSYVRNTDQVHMGAVDWPATICRRIIAGDENVAEGELSRSEAPIYHKPDDVETARFLVRQAVTLAKTTIRGLAVADHWEIGLVRSPIEAFADPAFEPKVEWLGLGAPRSHYAADPFAIADVDGGSPTVLYERYDRAGRIGEIWEATLDETMERVVSTRKSALPLTGHASYPYILEHRGRTWCVPQVSGDVVRIYERVDCTWVDRGVITHEELLDPTVVRYRDRWWLFATKPGPESLTNLWIWHAPELEGPWEPHVANPVKSDVRSARPAGTPFVYDGRLFRPAQDCSSGYGAGVALCEVSRLDALHFEEQLVRVVRPGCDWPHRAGIHTLSAVAGVEGATLIDARRPVFDRHELVVEARARLKKLSRAR